MSKNPYERRDRILLELGFASYESYLRGDLWKAIRWRVMEDQHWQCWSCENQAQLVHHRRYTRDVLLGLNVKPLIALCVGCHDYGEFDPYSGEKRRLLQANAALREIRRIVQMEVE